MNQSDVISVIVRILPAGDELDVELPLYSTSKEIIEELLNAGLGIERSDSQGNPHIFQLISKENGRELLSDKTLYDCGVKPGQTLLLTPKLVAGKELK